MLLEARNPGILAGSRVTDPATLVAADRIPFAISAQEALTQARARLGLQLEGSDDKVAIEETGTTFLIDVPIDCRPFAGPATT